MSVRAPRFALVAALVAFATCSFAQKTIRVPADQPTIQAGIDTAASGDTVLVSPGTYYEHIDFKGKAITVSSSDGAVKTTIDGGKAPGMATVIFNHAEKTTSILSGFTVRGGGDGTFLSTGVGGIFAGAAAPTIRDNVVTANYCTNIYIGGGTGAVIQNNRIYGSLGATNGSYCTFPSGINLQGTTSLPGTLVTGNVIENNTGGGINLWAAQNVTIQNNIIRNNTSPGAGSAIATANSTATAVVQNLIYGNTSNCGGAIEFENGGLAPGPDVLIANNTIVNNLRGPSSGASNCINISQIYPGAYGYGDSGPSSVIVNNIISGNTSYPAVNCAWFSKPSEGNQPIFDHNILYNSGNAFFGSFCVDTSGKYGNITADPQFVDAANGDFHLKGNSPAIDAGSDSALQMFNNLVGAPLTKDYDGNPREQNATGQSYPIVDMGAYEYAGSATGAPTRVVLTSSAYYGVAAGYNTVKLTATFTSRLGVPTGNAAFSIDGKGLGTAAIQSNGIATLTNFTITPGIHSLVVNYPGDGAFTAATSVIIIVDIALYSSQITITGSPNPSFAGQPVTFSITANSSDSGFIPSPITITDGMYGPVLGTVTPDSTGKASFTTSTLTPGIHSIVAAYAGDTSHASTSATAYETVIDSNATSSSLSYSPHPCVAGAPETLSVRVASTGGTAPTGSVAFSSTGSPLGTVALDSTGRATLTLSTFVVGSNTVVATYVPTGSFEASTASISFSCLSGYATSITVSASPNPSVQGQNVTFTATTTSPNGVPTGTVQFAENQNVLFTAPVDATGHAVFSTSSLSPGTHDIYATFVPTGSFSGSSALVIQNVQAITNAINLTSSLNPANYGDPLTFTAFVSTNSGQPVTGIVNFYQSTLYLGQQAVDATGKASITLTNAAYYFGIGSFTIVATFTPTGSNTLSAQTTLSQSVVGLPSAIIVTANPISGTAYSNTITLTATVSPVTAGKPTPTGSVLFYLNGAQLGTAPLVNGVATYPTSLPGGTNHVYAIYLATSSSGYNGSTSNTADITISPASSSLLLSSTPNPSLALSPVSFTAQMTLNGAQPAPAGLPVIFTVTSGTQVIASATSSTNASGIASTPISLPAGTYTVVASFNTTSSVIASVSPAITQVVAPLIIALSLTATPNPAYENQPVTFAVQISSAVAPVGTVVVYDGAAALQTLNVTAAQTTATFTLNTLSVGTHTLTATFTPAGGNFLPGTSAPVSLIILPQSFTVTLSDDHPSIPTGHHRSLTVSINSIGGLAAPFTLACGTGLPQWTSCQWGQSSLNLPANGTVSTQLTIDTNQLPGFLVGQAAPHGASPLWNIRFAAFPLAILLLVRRRTLRTPLPRLLSILLLTLGVSAFSGCGANKYPYSTAPGTYTVPLVVTEHPTTAGSSIVTRTVNVTLTVTN